MRGAGTGAFRSVAPRWGTQRAHPLFVADAG